MQLAHRQMALAPANKIVQKQLCHEEIRSRVLSADSVSKARFCVRLSGRISFRVRSRTQKPGTWAIINVEEIWGYCV
jgi:hypothetical protein